MHSYRTYPNGGHATNNNPHYQHSRARDSVDSQQQEERENNGSGRTFGDIKIDHIPQKDDAKKEQVDEEYVDYEEIDKD